MAYIALYRRFRPRDFDSLVGQEHISRTLVNAIKTGKIAHAYLFSGPRGTGKTSTAKIFAKALNCEQGPTPNPCNVCACCQKINSGSSMDVFEIDAASNRGIDEIRDLRETVKFAPVDGRYKVYIIDEVHMLTTEAFNALLKTLEEPPVHVVFILATTEAHKVPATIHSRCQRYDFKRISVAEIQNRLMFAANEMQIDAEPEALRLIAVHADGGLRDALSTLDQCSAADDEAITVEKVRKLLGLVGHEWIWRIVDFLTERKAKELLQVMDELIAMGKDVKQILGEIALHMRAVMLYQASGDIGEIDVYSQDQDVLKKHSEKLTYEEIVGIIQKMHNALAEAKWSPQPRITAEVALLSLCDVTAKGALNEEMLLKKIERLEEKIERLAAVRLEMPKPMPASAPVLQSAPDKRAKPVADEAVTVQYEESFSETAASGDAKAVWEKMLQILMQTGKRSVYACVSQGKLRSFGANQMVIAFTAGFPKERTEKNDYRELLEKTLSEICHTPIAVRCTLESVVQPKAVKPPIKKKETVEVGKDLSAQEKQVIDTAVQVFGDNFIKS